MPALRLRPLLSLLAAAFALGAGGCNVDAQRSAAACRLPAGVADQRGLVVVDTDFASTSVVVVGWDGASSPLLASDSGGVGLSATLSGDVVVARGVSGSGDVVLLDRGSGVVTWVAPATCGVRTQLSVGAFVSDPHDYVELGGKAYVTRYRDNPDPAAAPADRGGDVLVIDPSIPRVLRSIDVRSWVPVDVTSATPTPDRLLAWHGVLVVVLQGFDPTYDAATDATLAVIDPATDEVISTTSLPGLKDCNAIEALDADRVAVLCSGLFKSFAPGAPPISPAEGAKTSGVAVLAPGTDGGLEVERILHASDLGDQPLGFSLGVVDATHVVVTSFGNLDFGQTDAVFELDLASDAPLLGTPIPSTKAFDFGDVVCDAARGCVLADAQRDTHRGALRRFLPSIDGLSETTHLAFEDQVGLQPTHLGRL